MKKPHIVDDQEILRFNWKRENLKGKELSRKELEKVLESLNYNVCPLLISSIVSGVNPPVIRVSRGRYVFNANPVYKERLQTVFTRKKKVQQGKDKDVLERHIQSAIALLKRNGYKIFKQKTEYEEV